NAGAADLPEKKDAHAHLVPARKSNRLERKPDLHGVPVFDNSRGAIPNEIGLELLSGRGCVQSVHLNAAGVHKQVIRGLTRSGRIEAEGKPIVVEGRIAAADCGTNLARFRIEAMDAEVEISVIVSYSDVCALVRLSAPQWIVGDPVAHLQRRLPPDFIIQNPINLWRQGGAHDPELRPALGAHTKGNTYNDE